MKINYVIGLILVLLHSSIFSQWTQIDPNLIPWGSPYSFDAYDSLNLIVCADNIYKSSDGAATWSNISPPNFKIRSGIDAEMVNKDNIWVVTGDSKIFYTMDGGLNWELQYSDTTKTDFFNYIEMFDLQNGIAMGDPVGENDPTLFLKTNDGGQNWISVNDSLIGAYSGDRWRRLDFISMGIGYFYALGTGSDKRLIKTVDGGSSWTSTNFDSHAEIIKFYNENIGITKVGGWDSVNEIHYSIISRTLDGGETWEYFKTDFEGWGNDFEFVPGDPSQIWFVDRGLFYSSDTGRTWSLTEFSDASLVGRDIGFMDERNAWLCGDGIKLLFTNNNGGLVTDIGKKDEILPAEFMLEQNYPNPFNPMTTIKYRVSAKVKSQKSNVVLIVYDVIGKEVAELVNENKSAGNYEVNFDASDLASGIYYYQLVIDDFIQTKKMILLK